MDRSETPLPVANIDWRWEVTTESDGIPRFSVDERGVYWVLYGTVGKGSTLKWKNGDVVRSQLVGMFDFGAMDMVADARGATLLGLRGSYSEGFEVVLRDKIDTPSPAQDVILGKLPASRWPGGVGAAIFRFGVSGNIDDRGTRHICANVAAVKNDVASDSGDQSANEIGYLAWASFDGMHTDWQQFAASADDCTIATGPGGAVWIAASSRGHVELFSRPSGGQWARSDLGEGHDPAVAVDPRTARPVIVWTDCVRADTPIGNLAVLEDKTWSQCRTTSLHVARDANLATPRIELIPVHGGRPRIAITSDDRLVVVYSEATGRELDPTWTQRVVQSTALDRPTLSFGKAADAPGELVRIDAAGRVAFAHQAVRSLVIEGQGPHSPPLRR
jgi:hypothetical protein